VDEPTFLGRRDREPRLVVGVVTLTAHLAQFAALRKLSATAIG
jgi:hypothetical protein